MTTLDSITARADALSAPSQARLGSAGFAEALARRTVGETPEEKARGAAQEFVSIALVQPILSSLRESNQAAAPFAPGEAERRFGPMLDAEIAQRIVEREDYDLVNAVAQQLRGGRGAPSRRPMEVDVHA